MKHSTRINRALVAKKCFNFSFKSRWLLLPLMLFTLSIGQMWADYTVTFKTSGSGEKTTMTDIVNSGGDYLSACTGSKTYTESSGLRFGTGSGKGNVVCTMTSTGTYIGQVQASKITLKDVKKYSNDDSPNVKTTITYTDDTKTEDNYTAPATATDHDINLTSTKTIKSVKIESTANSKRFHVKGFTVVAATVSGPTITKSSSMTTLTYSNGDPVAQNFTIGGSNLTNDVIVTAPTDYEVCKTSGGTYTSSITYTAATVNSANQTVYVRLKEDLSGGNISSRNINIESEGATAQTIAVTGSVPYKIVWMANGKAHATTYVTVGSTLALPATAPVPNTCGCTGKAFYGWYGGGTSYKNASVAPSIAAAGNTVNADKTYYAVFADAEEGEDASSITTFASGTYYLVDTYDNKYFAASGTGANVTGVDITSAVTANQDGTISIDASNNVITAAMQYIVTKGAETATVQNVSNSSYIGGGSNTSFTTTSTNQWTVTKHSTAGRFTFVYSSRCILYRSGYNFRNYGTGNRNSSGYGLGYLFLVPTGGGTTYSNFETSCCTSLGTINGSVSETIVPTQNSVTIEWDNVSGASNWAVACKQGGSAYAAAQVGEITNISNNTRKQCTISNLAAGIAYTFTVSADLTGYCTSSVSEDVAGSTAAAYTITANAGANGSVSVSGTAITATPNTGYKVADGAAGYTVTAGNGNATVTNNNNNTISISNQTGNITLTVNFVQIDYTVTMAKSAEAASDAAVTILANQSNKHYNDEITVSVTAHPGYLFTGWTASPSVEFDDATAESTTFPMPNGNVTITANFSKILSVAEARIIIDGSDAAAKQNRYVGGIVSEIVTAYDSEYGNISYNISSDGLTTSDQIQAFRGKSYAGAWFTSADDIQVGDEVIVYGNLTYFSQKSLYELEANNQLYYLFRKALESIAVKTQPTKTAYNVNDHFDPTGLVITLTYNNNETEDVAYAGNESDFTFTPTTSASLTLENTSVRITYDGKYVDQAITVTRIPTTLSWSANSYDEVEGASTHNFPTLTTSPANLSGVTYSSSNTEVASINQTSGAITLTGATGETTITASFAQTSVYAAATPATYTLTITEDTDPRLEVDPNSLTFTNVAVNENDTKSFELYGFHLTADASLAIDGDGKDMFSVTSSIEKDASDEIAEDVEVTYAPTAAGTHVATLTITSGDVSKTVSLNGTAKNKYTITWKVGGAELTGSALTGVTTEVLDGEGLTTLPSVADDALNNALVDKFVGWSTSELTGTGNNAPSILFKTANAAPPIDGNKVFHAVFAKETTTGADVNTIVWAENFSGWSNHSATPSGSFTNSHDGTTVYGSNTVTYTCVNGGSNTQLYGGNENLYAGGEKPELLVGKNTGSFSVSGIPNAGASVLTVSYKQNDKELTVSSSGTGYSGSTTNTPAEATTESFDVAVSSNADATFALTFTPGSNNVRLDDIEVKVKTQSTSYANYITKVVALSSIAISTPPTKTAYKKGETLNLTNMVVTATYADNSQHAVTGYSVTPSTSTALATTDDEFEVSYTEGNVTKKATQTIHVYELDNIAVATQPSKTTYQDGDSFDKTGMVVKATWGTGENKIEENLEANAYTVTPSLLNSTNITFVTISYTDDANDTKTTTQAVTVTERPNLEITWNVAGDITPDKIYINNQNKYLLVLPEDPDPVAVGFSSDYVFKGWTNESSIKKDGTDFAKVNAGAEIAANAPEAQRTFYAVFAQKNGEDTPDGYKLVNAAPADGETVIFARKVDDSYYAFNNTASSTELTITDGAVASTTSVLWDAKKANSGVYMYVSGQTTNLIHMNSNAFNVTNATTNGDIVFSSNGDGTFKATRADGERWIVTSGANGFGCSSIEANAVALYIFKYSAATSVSYSNYRFAPSNVKAPTGLTAGTYYCGTKTIELAQADSKAIYYTTDGTTPSISNGTAYTVPFSINASGTVKAVAYDSETEDYSSLVEATYELISSIDAPTITTTQVFYGGSIDVEISHELSGTEGFLLQYSYDGENYVEYTEPLTIKEDKTVYAKATIGCLEANAHETYTQGRYITYWRVTNANQLRAGQHAIIAQHVGTDGTVVILDSEDTKNFKGKSSTATNSGAIITPAFEAYELTIEVPEKGKIAFKNSDGKYLYTASNSANQLKTESDLDENGKWAITIDEDKKASIVATGSSNRQYMRYNPNNGTPVFACYAGANDQSPLALYVNEICTDINVSALEDNADVTIGKDATLTIDEEKTLNDITVNEGATVTVNEQLEANDMIVEAGGKVTNTSNLTVNNLTIETSLGTVSGTDGNTDGKSGQISGSINATGDAFIQIELTQASEASYGWYAFSVPFQVDAINGVYYGNTKLKNEEDYAIMAFHEDKYAAGEYAWKKYRTIMEPGHLYIISVGDTDYKTLRFKKVAGAPIVASNEVELARTDAGDNAGWNGVGNPNLQVSHQDAISIMQFLDHEDNSFMARPAAQTDLMVGTAFMLQRPNETSSIEIVVGGNTGDDIIALAPAREPAAIEKTLFEAKLTNITTGKTEDNLYFTAREDATNTYEAGRDVTKLSMGTAKNAQMTISAYGKQLCAADFPLVNGQAAYPLTITAPKAGNYAISAEDSRVADVYLTQNGSIIWNLSMSAYELELTKGTTEGYGLLLQAKAPGAATGVDNIDASEAAQKVIINDHVYILRNGQMYDVNGKAVR